MLVTILIKAENYSKLFFQVENGISKLVQVVHVNIYQVSFIST